MRSHPTHQVKRLQLSLNREHCLSGKQIHHQKLEAYCGQFELLRLRQTGLLGIWLDRQAQLKVQTALEEA